MSSMTAGTGTASESFSFPQSFGAAKRPVRTVRPSAKRLSTSSAQAVTTAKRAYRPRFWAHIGLMGITASLLAVNSPTHVHGLSVRLMSSHAGIVVPLDDAATAQVAAAMADTSHLVVADAATKVASAKTQQVSLLSADDTALTKPQIVATSGNAARTITKYAVQPGDTLGSVAEKFNVTTATVKWANDLASDDALAPGENLTILPVSGLAHTVAAGETPETLASAYHANADQIVSYNNAEIKGIAPGEQIIIPDGVKPEPPKPVVAAVKPEVGVVAGAATTASTSLTRFVGNGNTYAMGYCTYYVASRRSIPSNWGNANQWYYNAQASGFSVGSVPVPGAIAWTGAGYYGHVAYVESVSGNMVTVSEMNFNGGWNRVSTRTTSASSFRYIY